MASDPPSAPQVMAPDVKVRTMIIEQRGMPFIALELNNAENTMMGLTTAEGAEAIAHCLQLLAADLRRTRGQV